MAVSTPTRYASNGMPLVQPKKGEVFCRHCGMPQRIHAAPCTHYTDEAKLLIDDEDPKPRKGAKVAAGINRPEAAGV